MRTLELMDLANRTGGLVVGTGDLSELALGWATYNGDHMSMYGVNAGVPKTLVRYHRAVRSRHRRHRRAARCAARYSGHPGVARSCCPPEDGEIAQKTEDLVGPYELHDFYLYYVLRCGFGPAKIYRLAKVRLCRQGRVHAMPCCYKWLQQLLLALFCPAVQAQLPARRPQGGLA